MRNLALVLAAASGGVLIVMVALGMATGATQEPHEWYQPSAEYTAGLLQHPGALRAMFGLDIGFLVLYTAFFAALSAHLRDLGRPFTMLALAFLVGTTVLDVIEDHHILTLLAMAEHHEPISDSSIALQQVMSSTKFSLSYIALFLYGVAVPRDTKLGVALALFLTVGTIATAIAGYALPAAMRQWLESGRWVGFLLGFALAGAWLRTTAERSAS